MHSNLQATACVRNRTSLVATFTFSPLALYFQRITSLLVILRVSAFIIVQKKGQSLSDPQQVNVLDKPEFDPRDHMVEEKN